MGGLIEASTGWILGWTLLHSAWQGALVAGGLALVLRFIPNYRARVRNAAAWGALFLVIGLAAATWTLVDAEWRGHVACWESERFAAEHASLCAGHAVPAARAALDTDEKVEIASPLSWMRRMTLPVPPSVRSLSLAATGGVAFLALLWVGFVLATLVRLTVGVRLLRRIVDRARPLPRDELEGLLRHTRVKTGIANSVELRESSEISTPAVAGWRRPVILLPDGMANTLEPERLADVLAHELAHIRGRHFALNVGQRVLDCLCALNPFALWISGRIREEREVHCDRIAAGAPAAEKRRYAETLVQLERLRSPSGPALVGLVGEGCLVRRIRRLVADTPPGRSTDPSRASRRTWGAAGAAAGTVVFVIWVSMTTVTLTSWAVMSHDIDLRRDAAATEAVASIPAGTTYSERTGR